ncbi:MAG: hypothetical protein KAH31_11585, partial [Candidatus Sabulitectum sp.]|nr:hypothetical protein [Candidatus Sabulitectum sp.]
MKRYDGCDVEPATSCPLEDAAGSADRALEPSTYYPLDDDDDGSVGSALEPTASDPLVAAAGSAGRAFEPSTYYPLDDDDDDDSVG